MADRQIEGFRKIPISNGQFYVVMVIRIFYKAAISQEGPYDKTQLRRWLKLQFALILRRSNFILSGN